MCVSRFGLTHPTSSAPAPGLMLMWPRTTHSGARAPHRPRSSAVSQREVGPDNICEDHADN
eukprot:1138165-Prymnesium_polylepis.1